MTKPRKRATPGAEPLKKPKRIRLTPEVRRKQILDAALVEFTAHGFAATSIAKIAQRIGMSKANVYVHFETKDEIFETLIGALLGRSQDNWTRLQAAATDVDSFIDDFIDVAYDALTDDTIGILRLLIAESHRVPALLEKWSASNAGMHARRQSTVDALVAAGMIKPSPLTENFSFTMAPILYVALAKMILPRADADRQLAGVRETHRQLLKQLLTP
jgi:AcrR family transcriptional regulator